MSSTTSEFAGFIERISGFVIAGWVVDKADVDRLVTVRIVINGAVVATALADRVRRDVGQKFESKGRHAFEYRLPGELADEQVQAITVLPDRSDVCIPIAAKIKQFGEKTIGLAGEPHHKTLKKNTCFETKRPTSPIQEVCAAEVAIIVLNRNGSRFLTRLFESFYLINTYVNYKFFLVDHGSSDESFETIQHWQKSLNITLIQRGGNASYSESNNVAADIASDYEVVCFLNNDIEWIDDVLPRMVTHLSQPHVGAVGVKLLRRESFNSLDLREPHHVGVNFDFSPPHRPFQPYEMHHTPSSHSISDVPASVPGVTAALIAMRRDDFVAIGGFDEGYFYGYEDVDLCLMIRSRLGKDIICLNDINAVHDVSGTRSEVSRADAQRISHNYERLMSRVSPFIREARRNSILGYATPIPFQFRIAFAVTSRNFEGAAADYFTAFELGEYLEKKYRWQVWYLEPDEWYDLEGFDALVAMRHDYDPSKIKTISPYCALIGWARNWFDSWIKNPSTQRFDQIWCGSELSAKRISAVVDIPCPVIRIAGNAERFAQGRFSQHFASDYCFTGSYFNSKRQLSDACRPGEVPFSFKVFGHGWEQEENFAAAAAGPVSYLEMPDVYASTKLVLDDANFTTINWACVNSRVYDALSAGVLVITNSQTASDEVFGGKLPVYKSAEDLTKKITYFLSNDIARKSLVTELQGMIFKEHTYSKRADQAVSAIRDCFAKRPKASIALHGGDARRAKSTERMLRRALTTDGLFLLRAGRSNVVDQVLKWGDDVHIDIISDGPRRQTLQPLPGQINFLVDFTRDGVISSAEYEGYDKVFKRSGKDESDAQVSTAISSELLEAANSLRIERREIQQAEFFGHNDSSDFLVIDQAREPFDELSLIFFPDYRKTNQYQELIYSEFPDGSFSPGTLDDAIRAQSKKADGQRVIFHIHWTSAVIGAARDADEAEKRIKFFVNKVENFKKAGGFVLWTVHNRVSHEGKFRVQEIKLCEEVSRLADKIHLHSDRTIDLVSDLYKIPSEKCFIGFHGNYIGMTAPAIVDAKSLHPGGSSIREKFDIPTDAIVYLFFGQVRAYKGVMELISAFRKFSSSVSNAHLIIVGSLVGLEESQLRNISAGSPFIHFNLIFVPDEEVAAYFLAADVIVLPYRDILTSGSLLLSYSFGKAVIAPHTGLIPETAIHGRNAILYSGDGDALLGAIRDFYNLDEVTRSRMGRAALRTALALPWRHCSGAILRECALPKTFQESAVTVGDTVRRCFIRESDIRDENVEVATIIVHYQGISDTVRCLASLMEQQIEGQKIIIVCTGESPRDAVSLAGINSKIMVIQCCENLGYAGGNNLGIALAEEFNAQYLWILNPDCTVPSGFLRSLIRHADMIGGETLFGTTIVFGDSPSKIWFCGGKITTSAGVRSSHELIGRPLDDAPIDPFDTDYLTGANIFGSINVFRKIGLLPEDYFLYFEETDWCLRALRIGIRLVVLPELVLNHFKRSEIDGIPTQVYFYYFVRNCIRLSNKDAGKNDEYGIEVVDDFVRGWLEKIAAVRPDIAQHYNDLVRIAVHDAHSGVSGRSFAPGISPL